MMVRLRRGLGQVCPRLSADEKRARGIPESADMCEAGGAVMPCTQIRECYPDLHFAYALQQPTGNVNVWVYGPGGWTWSGPAPAPAEGPPNLSKWETRYAVAVYPSPTAPNTGAQQGTQAASVRLINTTRGGAEFRVGDQFRLEISSNIPNAEVKVAALHDGVRSEMVFGKTDASGRFVLTGQMADEHVGQWLETWYVGSVAAAPTLLFRVEPRPPEQVTQPPPSDGTAAIPSTPLPPATTPAAIVAVPTSAAIPYAKWLTQTGAISQFPTVPNWAWLAGGAALLWWVLRRKR